MESISKATKEFNEAKKGMEYFNVLNRKNANQEFKELLEKQKDLFVDMEKNETQILDNYKLLIDLITE